MNGQKIEKAKTQIDNDHIGEKRGKITEDRFGGDEFYLFTNNVEAEDNLRIFLTAARQQIRYTFEKKHPELHVTLSIGVSLYPDDGRTYDELFQKADKCLYIAKSRGKNRFIIYDEENNCLNLFL